MPDTRKATTEKEDKMKDIAKIGEKREATKPVFDAKERAEIVSKFNLGNIVRSLGGDDVDAGYEKEVGLEAVHRESEGRRNNTEHGGFYIPDFVLGGIRTMTGKTDVDGHITGNGAALVSSDLLMNEFVTPLEARLILAKLGVRFLDGLVGDIFVPKSSGVSAYWINAEDGSAQKVNPTFSQLPGTPHTCGAYVDITRKLAVQTSPRTQAFIGDLILRAVARGLEVAAIGGSGTDGEPTGLVNTVGVTTVSGITPGKANRDNILDFEAAIEDANADTDRLAWLMPSKVKAALKKIAEFSTQTTEAGTVVNVGTKHLYENGNVDEYPAFMSNVAPAKKLILGDWSEMILCRWGQGIEVMADKYSLSTSGGIRLVTFLDADVIVRQPGAFAVGTILK